MGHITIFPPSSQEEQDRFLNVIQASPRVRRHFDLFCWLQGDLQFFLPHEILLAAWGDLTQGLMYVDVVSPLPGVRTEPMIERDFTPLVGKLFAQWRANRCTPLLLSSPDGFGFDDARNDCALNRAFREMRSGVAHGIKDERGQHDCLYVIFSKLEFAPPSAAKYMEVLLPHIDTALRQVVHLPEQLREESDDNSADYTEDFGLSERELEIMEWVRSGKTNYEIGLILQISAFTVKNHLQRVFRKLNVSNRAQAVAKFAKVRRPAHS